MTGDLVCEGRNPGWWWAENELVDVLLPKLGPAKFAAYCILARMANGNGECFPAYQKIAELLGCTRRHAMRLVQELVAEGLVETRFRTNAKGQPTSNLFVIKRAGTGQGVVTSRSLRSDIQVTGVVTSRSPEQDLEEQDPRKSEGAPRRKAIYDTSGLNLPALLEEYFGRTIQGSEYHDVKHALDRYAEQGKPVTPEQMQRAIDGSREACTRKTGRNPKNVSWLINELADVVNAPAPLGAPPPQSDPDGYAVPPSQDPAQNPRLAAFLANHKQWMADMTRGRVEDRAASVIQ